MGNVWAILLTALGGAVLIAAPAAANWLFEKVQELSRKADALNPLVKRAIVAFATVLFVQLVGLFGVTVEWTDLTAVTSQEWANLLSILLGQLFKTQDKLKEATKDE